MRTHEREAAWANRLARVATPPRDVEHAVREERAVDAAWTSNRSRASALSNSDSKPYRGRSPRRVDARWTPKLVLVAPADNEGADQQELPEAL